VEGIKSTSDSNRRVWGVQFHPESAGGPLDTMEVLYSFFEGLILRSYTGTQMFTEFVAECRAERLKARPAGTSADVSAMPQKKEPFFKEALGLTAVAA